MKTARYPRPVPHGLPRPTTGRHRTLQQRPEPRPSMSRADMLRETCPADLDEIDLPPQAGRPPSAWVLFAPPLAICFGVVLLAALHTALGSPLGPAWSAEVWDMAKMSIVPTIAATAFGAYVRRQNADNMRQIRADREAALAEAELDNEPPPPRARVRQTGPHRSLSSGSRRLVEAEPVDEEGGPW